MSSDASAEHENLSLDGGQAFVNRELSWLEFNERVLQQGRDRQVPLMERLKFLAIVCSNLDEFFMIRVGGLMQQHDAGAEVRDISGMTPAEQLGTIGVRAHRMTRDHSEAVKAVFRELAGHDLHLLAAADVNPEQAGYLDSYFESEVLPLLTPLATEELAPFPSLPGLSLNLALMLEHPDYENPRIAVVPLPANLPRFITLPAAHGLHLARLEHVVRRGVHRLFPGSRVAGSALFRLARDADVAIAEDEAADLLNSVEDAVRERRRRAVVRLEVSADSAPYLRSWLQKRYQVSERDLYEVDGLLAASDLMSLAARPGFDELRYKPWPPQPARDLLGAQDIWSALQERDALLLHPYESFEPVVSLLERAAEDPSVLAIKQTLYRTSGQSPIVAALAAAAQKGKQVIVLVELKARFDEARNVHWARRLEDAGCHVIYGIAGLKTHAKVLLIIRRESHGIRRYVHLSTGNYNSRTAKLYSDIGLMTTDPDVAADASAFFNLLTGYSQEVGWSQFSISPTGLRQQVVEMIDREVRASTPDQPGLITAKMNSLQDEEVIRALYRASRAGVRIRLNVRGICCLRPGVAGLSDTIEVTSIVDRYLEHARVYCFRNGGHEEVYLASADWMSRNLDRRLEVLFPVNDPRLRRRLQGWMEVYFADNVKARRMLPDGTYERVPPQGPLRRAQEELYREAVTAVESEERAPLQFRPLRSPKAAD